MSAELEAPTEAPSVHRLGRRALSLGVAKAFDFAIQFLLPVVLVRFLDAEAFGQYRLLWLAVGTVMAIATLDMPATLYYFLPRSDGETKRLYINQTLVFLVFTGLVSAWALSPWNPWLPEKMRDLTEHDAVVSAFVLLWVVAALLDLLPTIEERVTWQAKVTVGLAALRAVALSLAAVLTHELGPVLQVLLAFVAFKVALLVAYVARHHGLHGPILRPREFADQLKYAAPLGAAGALYGLRLQADQWVAAALFSLGMFASFSIAAVLGPMMNLFRLSVSCAFLPSMSRSQATGDIRGMLQLNSRANIMVGTIVCPMLAFAFVFAEEIVTLVYTATYVDAAPVMRVYIVGLAAHVLETASITMLLRQGPFVMCLNLVALILAVALDWLAALRFGLAGAAVGSVTVIYLDRLVTLWRIAGLAGVPVRRLQDWRALGLRMLFAVLAAVLAWGTVARVFPASGPLVNLIVGGTVLAVAYAAIAELFGMGWSRFAAARDPGPGL
jgi:O-antigen/teichoic acid export membrane protein